MYEFRRRNHGGQGKRKKLLYFVVGIIVIGGLSFGAAAYWQSLAQASVEEAPDPSVQSNLSQSGEPQSATDPQASIATEGSQSQSDGQTQQSQQSSLTDSTDSPFEDLAEVVVAKGDWVDSSYFDDAAFVGDSITYGMQVYNTMTNATVIAHTGINPQTILTKRVIVDGEETLTVLEALERDDPSKIYVMMGANGVAFFDEVTMMNFYGQLLDSIKEQHPNATIYVQSILPVTAEKNEDARYSNDKIDQYNIALMNLAKEKGLYYLNVAEAFKNEEGHLPTEASPKDGMHFGATYYMKWFDYLKSHAVL